MRGWRRRADASNRLSPGVAIPITVLVAWGIAGTVVLAQARPEQSPPEPPAGQQPVSPFDPARQEPTSPFEIVEQDQGTRPPPDEYSSGAVACAECHLEEFRAYRASLHGQTLNPRAPRADHECETCHGPGAAHVYDPGIEGLMTAFDTMAPREVNTFCLTCHDREEHAQWEGGMHDARNVSCIDCHSVMAPKSPEKLLAKITVTDTCAQCHREKAAKLLGSAHMPVREGKMECTTCHNQHGSTNVRMLRVGNTTNELCTSCHAEKRGPFLWEHPPVRESCATCHDPHGSTNDRMLAAKVPFLCQRCHVASRHPAAIYDARLITSGGTRFVGRGCVNCHSQIHGSNHPSGFRMHR